MPRYAELIYNGFWFSPEREMLQALIDKSQEHSSKAPSGSSSTRATSTVVGRSSPTSRSTDAGPRHLRGRARRLRPAATQPASSA
ncbi:MAG: argininosuccinate synthase [Candidatus Kaistia colombiensis]|nr:MAG: argininosuccinate synthase [Kaistia sp.]